MLSDMRNFLRIDIRVCGLLALLALSGVKNALANPVTEVFLPRYQAEQLATDAPFSDIAVRDETTVGNQSDGEVWLAGRTSLWRWNFGEQSVRRYRLIEEPLDKNPVSKGAKAIVAPSLARILVEVSGNLLVASSDGLFEVEPESGRIFRYPLPEGVVPETTGLFGVGDRIVWTTRTHWIHLDRYGKRLQSMPLPPAARGAERVLWSPHSRSLWFARGQTLGNTHVVAENGAAKAAEKPAGNASLKSNSGAPSAPQARQVWLANSPLLGLAAGRGSVFAWSDATMARFMDAQDLRPLETVPVTPPRKLSMISIGLNLHAFLFADGTLELYDLLQRQRASYSLPLPAGRDANLVKRFVLSGPAGRAQVIAIVAGKPRVFSLAKDLSLSPKPTKLEP